MSVALAHGSKWWACGCDKIAWLGGLPRTIVSERDAWYAKARWMYSEQLKAAYESRVQLPFQSQTILRAAQTLVFSHESEERDATGGQ